MVTAYVPFTFSNVSGFVPAEAVKTFTRKREAVALMVAMGTPQSEFGKAQAEKAMTTIQRANRYIKSKGWHLIDQKFLDHLIGLGRAALVP